MKSSTNANSRPKQLRGPSVQYADGTVIAGEPLDLDFMLDAFEHSEPEARRAFLCSFAHNLTVAIRALLVDRPVSENDLDRAYDVNEALHQLTSSANPYKQWSARDQALMLRAIVESLIDHELDFWAGLALATAGRTKTAENPIAAE